jgi:hypothetical protein
VYVGWSAKVAQQENKCEYADHANQYCFEKHATESVSAFGTGLRIISNGVSAFARFHNTPLVWWGLNMLASLQLDPSLVVSEVRNMVLSGKLKIVSNNVFHQLQSLGFHVFLGESSSTVGADGTVKFVQSLRLGTVLDCENGVATIPTGKVEVGKCICCAHSERNNALASKASQ